MLRTGFSQFLSLSESAYLDGANDFIIFSEYPPLSKAIIAVITLLSIEFINFLKKSNTGIGKGFPSRLEGVLRMHQVKASVEGGVVPLANKKIRLIVLSYAAYEFSWSIGIYKFPKKFLYWGLEKDSPFPV